MHSKGHLNLLEEQRRLTVAPSVKDRFYRLTEENQKVPGHTDCAKVNTVTRLESKSASAFWAENRFCVPSVEETINSVRLTFWLPLMYVCKCKALHTPYSK